MPTTLPELTAQVFRLSNQIIFLEKKVLIQHRGLTLHPSEIHLMQVVHQEEGLNATQIADRLGVTKGAVSQTISRLVKKGVMSKEPQAGGRKELNLTFTPLGREALELFQRERAHLREAYAAYLADLSPRERQTIAKFLARTQEFLTGLG